MRLTLVIDLINLFGVNLITLLCKLNLFIALGEKNLMVLKKYS
jgi:hypothetical protein